MDIQYWTEKEGKFERVAAENCGGASGFRSGVQ